MTKSKPKTKNVPFSIIQPEMKGGMLLSPLRFVTDNNGDELSWTMGIAFSKAPQLPVVVKIRAGYESAEPRPFLGVPPVISNEVYEVLKNNDVKNLDVYEAVLKSTDGHAISGYKVFNLVGLVPFKGISRTDLLMFRIEENTSAIFVHDRIRSALEKADIPYLNFLEPLLEDV